MAPPIELPDSLGDGRVRLRSLRKDDLEPWVRAFAEDPQLGVMTGTESDPTIAEMRERLKRWRDRAKSGLGAGYVIADSVSDELLGAVNLFALDWHSRRGEIGVWLAPEARGQGYDDAAVALLLDLAFSHLGLERIELTTIPENESVIELAQRLGFRREGVLRGRNVERGRRVDIVFHGLLREDWAARHAA